MNDTLGPNDVVRIPGGLPEHDIPPGAKAVILEIHRHPYLAYEVEVADEDGRTLFCGAVDPAAIELLTPPTEPRA